MPVAGIVDIMENYAFVRTSGYLPGPNDVYVALGLVKKYGLRKGDVITGMVRLPRDGEFQRQKFNPLVKVDTINGDDPEAAKSRVEFNKLTPLYPQERMRLETGEKNLTTRVIDLVAPIGKGQRGLIVSPPKAGTSIDDGGARFLELLKGGDPPLTRAESALWCRFRPRVVKRLQQRVHRLTRNIVMDQRLRQPLRKF